MEVIGDAKDEKDNLSNDTPGEGQAVDSAPTTLTSSPTDQPHAADAGDGYESSASTLATDVEAPTAKKPGRYELPEVWPSADLSQPITSKRWLMFSMALCFTISFLVYISLIPRFTLYSNPPTGDQPFYLMDTLSLVQDGDLNLANNYANSDFDKFYTYKPAGYVGMTAPYPLTPMLANTIRPNTEQYSFHLPGMAVWLVPAWIVGGWFSTHALPVYWPFTLVFMCLLGSLVGLNVFLLAHEITGRLWIAWAVWLPITFSAPIMIYSYLIFTEMPVGLLLIYAFRRLALGWKANSWWRLILVGLCIGYIPWLAWRCVVLSAVLALYALVQWARSNVPTFRRSNLPTLQRSNLPTFQRSNVLTFGLVFVPVALSAVLLLWFNLFMFGRAAPDNSVLEQGRIAIFYWPWTSVENLGKFITAAFGLFFDSTFGLFTYSPVYVLAIVGIIAMVKLGRRSDRRMLLWVAALALPYLSVICAFYAWHGVWCPPARYLATFVPLMAAPLAMALYTFSRSWLPGAIFGVIYAAATAFAFVPMAVWMLDGRNIWPLSPAPAYLWLAEDPSSFWKADPSSFWKVDLRRFTVDFRTPDDILHPSSSATLIGAAVLIVFLLYLFMLFQRVMRSRRHWPFVKQGLTWLSVFAVLGSSWFGMNYEYLRHKTVLTRQHSYILPVTLDEPYGITYMDDKVYVTSQARHTKGLVGALDVKAGSFGVFNLISPTLNGVRKEFEHPTDIKPGSDGLLYVLNNGEGEDALYVMKPDGEIVRQITLNSKTPIATGLYLGADGSYYIADMLGGRVLHYGKDGGETQGIWGGERGGFNNPAGVAVDSTGEVYATENGFGLVHELTPKGDFVRKYDIGCKPIHDVAHGDWIDVSCDNGPIVSINIKERFIQLSRFEPKDSRPDVARGLAYGPDDTLYMLDPSRSTITSYKVVH